MNYDFESFLFLTDDDFIEDRHLMVGGHPMFLRQLSHLKSLASNQGIDESEISEQQDKLHMALSEIVDCIEIEYQIADEAIVLYLSNRTGHNTPFLGWLKEHYDCRIIPSFSDYDGSWDP